jgi:hypothetical protein
MVLFPIALLFPSKWVELLDTQETNLHLIMLAQNIPSSNLSLSLFLPKHNPSTQANQHEKDG